jgi:malonate decarboxylase delta subunit
MLTLKFRHTAKRRLAGKRVTAIIGVVLLERVLPGAECEVDIATPIIGYDETWKAVIDEFVERFAPGGLRISINDGGARPDTVFLRLMQGSALMEKV